MELNTNNTKELSAGDILDSTQVYIKYRGHFDLGIDIVNYVGFLAEQTSEKKIVVNEGDFLDIISKLFTKAFKTYISILILCSKGHGEDASLLLRGLLENLFVIKYISRGKKKRTKLLYNYQFILLKQYFDKAQKYPKYAKLDRLDRYKLIPGIDSLYKRFKKYYPDERHWAGKSVKKIAYLSGLKPEYDFFYWYHSHLVHSNYDSLINFAKIIDSNVLYNWSASEDEIIPVLPVSIQIMLGILDIWQSEFQLGKASEIKTYQQRLRQMYSEIREE